MQRTTIRLPEELLDRAKRKAAAEGRTLTSLIEDGLRWIVSGEQIALKVTRTMPRISAETGGLKPGIDLAHSATLQEIDDLDYIRRLHKPE